MTPSDARSAGGTAATRAAGTGAPAETGAPAAVARPREKGIRVRVRLFARARELAGRPELELELPEGSDVGKAATRLGALHPALGPLLERCRFAVGESYVQPEHGLRGGDEVVVIPPIGGG